MRQVILASLGLVMGLAMAPELGFSAEAQGKPAVAKPGGGKARPAAVRRAGPPPGIRNVRPANTQANNRTRAARTTAGKSIGKPTTSPRRANARGVTFRAAAPGVVGGQGSANNRWSMETNRPVRNFKRSTKKVTKRGARGKGKRMKSARPDPNPPRQSRASVTSERLPRLRRDQQGRLVEQARTIPRGAGAQGLAYSAIGNVPATAPPAQPRRTWRSFFFGKKKTFKSAKRS